MLDFPPVFLVKSGRNPLFSLDVWKKSKRKTLSRYIPNFVSKKEFHPIASEEKKQLRVKKKLPTDK